MRPLGYIVVALLSQACAATSGPVVTIAAADTDAEARAFIDAYTTGLKPLSIAAGKAWYAASVTGTDADFATSRAAQDAVNAFLANAERFGRVRTLRDGGQVHDPILRRELDVMYRAMLGKQVEPELLRRITALESEVEQTFNTYRGKIAGREVTQNEIEQILDTSTKEKELRAAWEAQKAVGPLIAPKLTELVRLRNEVASTLGFRDFYALKLAEAEQDETALLALFDQLDQLTREPFLRAKAVVDGRLAKRLGIKAAALRPWHYQNPFFQEPPDVFHTGLDAIYKTQDTLALCRKLYASIGIDVDPILARSDLYEKPGKTPHAFSVDIDREGDVRVLANVVPGEKWLGTMVHELGHAVYDAHSSPELPWLLRGATHPLTTEGLAMMIDRNVSNPLWAAALGVIDTTTATAALPEAHAALAFRALQFSRWTQVMLRFERAMYSDPAQNLNTLWWDLVERYQGLTRPEGRSAPDYASKIHLVTVPVYYHNYQLGELFGAQLHEMIARELGTDPKNEVYVGNPKVGQILDRLFVPGSRYSWNEITQMLTGEPLSARAFARRFEGT